MALSTLVLPLLLLLLPPALCDYLSPVGHLSQDAGVDSDFHPIFLLPGMSCSDIEARLTEAYQPSAPHCGALKGKGWFPLWHNVSDVVDNDYVDCFLQQMSLVYDPAINEYRNLPGVETRVSNFGNTTGFGHKNPEMSDWCLGRLIPGLENLGYRDGDTMFGAPYDFRYAPPSPGQTSEVYTRYFKEFMELVETVTKRKQKKAIIFGHSFGGMVALEFVRNTPLAWRNEYIHHLVLVAPTVAGGFLEPVSNFASGTNIIYMPTTTLVTTRGMWRTFESSIMNFPSPAVFGHLPVVLTKERNYSAYDMERYLADVGCSEAVEPFRRRAVPKMDNFVAPMVPMTYINGVDNDTPLQLLFLNNDLNALPDFNEAPEEVAYGDGDAKINLITIQQFDEKMRQQPGQSKQFKSVKIEKARHAKIVLDEFSLQRVIQEIMEANQQIPRGFQPS